MQFWNFPYSLDCVSESFDLAVATAGQELKGAYKGSVHLTYAYDAGCLQPSWWLGGDGLSVAPGEKKSLLVCDSSHCRSGYLKLGELCP